MAALAAAALAGCATADAVNPADVTEFEAVGLGAYRYTALADVSFAEDDADAEARRIEWLERYLDDAGACPDGYEVTARRPVVVRQAALGPVHRIEYAVACRGGAGEGG